MLVKKNLLILLCLISFQALADSNVTMQFNELNLLEKTDNNYAEKKALFREIFTNGIEKIVAIVNQQKLPAKKWGVVFGMDDTLIDSIQHLANPGAVEVTCRIQKLGGHVVVITQSGYERVGNANFIAETSNSLKKQGICFDSIIFANNPKDSNKNPLFTAVNSGDYENIITSKRLPPIQVVAYFGSEIQDFPDLKQNLAKSLPISDAMFSNFGQKYFILPR